MCYVKLLAIYVCCILLISLGILLMEKLATLLWNRCGQNVKRWFKKPAEV
jgi:hypothetical protein